MDVWKELARIVAPFDVSVIERALAGEPTRFDVDGQWYAHHHGDPRCMGKLDAFDGAALLAGTQAVCWLGTHLPVGDARRAAVPVLHAKIVARLANPELLLYSGSPQRRQLAGPPHRSYDWRGQPEDSGVDTGAIVDAQNYLYFRPALLVGDADHAIARSGAELNYPNQTFPYSGLYHVWRVARSPGVAAIAARAATSPLPGGAYELDPRRSAPAIVAEVRDRYGLDELAATLYLQLLALADCGDAWLREVNGWTKKTHDAAAGALLAAGLVITASHPRANRKLALAGTWEKLFPPHPAIERWKLEHHDARMDGKALAAPLGRVLPLRPVHELFAAAWQRTLDAATHEPRPTIVAGRDWIAELRAAPDDDNLRQVWGDWLAQQGDARGELVTIQCRRKELARTGGDPAAIAELAAAADAVIAKYRDAWIEAVHPFVEDVHFDRGAITGITVRAPMFAKHAPAIVAALPLLEELVPFHTGGIGPIPRKHLELLVGCAELARLTRLDFTPDHYLASADELQVLLAGEFLPRLRSLRLGYHRGGEGFSTTGAELIAGCERLAELRFLELPGNLLGLPAMTALLAAPSLRSLEVLRVPYNGLRSGDVDALIDQLERGALPALRVLDVSNVIDTTDITKACTWHRNRIGLDRQQRLLHVLAERQGSAARYREDAAADVGAQGGFTGRQLEQTGRFPFAELAKSGTSRCVVCRRKIAIRTLRIGIERELDAVGRVTSWLHPECRSGCPELQDLTDLDERLTRNSHGVWPG
jgi:uncharacterized protein (TIGR02996 family)